MLGKFRLCAHVALYLCSSLFCLNNLSAQDQPPAGDEPVGIPFQCGQTDVSSAVLGTSVTIPDIASDLSLTFSERAALRMRTCRIACTAKLREEAEAYKNDLLPEEKPYCLPCEQSSSSAGTAGLPDDPQPGTGTAGTEETDDCTPFVRTYLPRKSDPNKPEAKLTSDVDIVLSLGGAAHLTCSCEAPIAVIKGCTRSEKEECNTDELTCMPIGSTAIFPTRSPMNLSNISNRGRSLGLPLTSFYSGSHPTDPSGYGVGASGLSLNNFSIGILESWTWHNGETDHELGLGILWCIR